MKKIGKAFKQAMNGLMLVASLQTILLIFNKQKVLQTISLSPEEIDNLPAVDKEKVLIFYLVVFFIILGCFNSIHDIYLYILSLHVMMLSPESLNRLIISPTSLLYNTVDDAPPSFIRKLLSTSKVKAGINKNSLNDGENPLIFYNNDTLISKVLENPNLHSKLELLENPVIRNRFLKWHTTTISGLEDNRLRNEILQCENIQSCFPYAFFNTSYVLNALPENTLEIMRTVNAYKADLLTVFSCLNKKQDEFSLQYGLPQELWTEVIWHYYKGNSDALKDTSFFLTAQKV